METMRTTQQWFGATAQALASYPATAAIPNPAMQWMAAWGSVTERSFARMAMKPNWRIDDITTQDGRDHEVEIEVIDHRDFGDLIHFNVKDRAPRDTKVLLIAPMSGHYATLLRSTVVSLLPDCELYITDWHNARDIPVSAGKFDVEDYTLYLADFMQTLGPDLNVIAVCQPVPLAMAATAYLAETDPKAQPKTLTLMGGPADPDANPTGVTNFGHSVQMAQLEQGMIQRVGFKFAGVGRKVYPGLLQLMSFMSMNAENHSKKFMDQIMRVAQGDDAENDRHNKFYDEYLAVMDMTAEFYLSTVERIFKKREIADNKFTLNGTKIDLTKIKNVAIHIIEGENDDISAPGQCSAALDMLSGVDEAKKAQHIEPKAGHYGIFAGSSWRSNIRPKVLDFMRQHAG